MIATHPQTRMAQYTAEAMERNRLRAIPKPVPFPGVWDFLSRAVWTRDEARGEIRQFPANNPRYEYLRELSDLRATARIFAVEKSRRMLITWWLLCEYLYDTLTQPNHANFVGSRKAESSAFLLGPDRMLFIYNHIPATAWPNKPRLESRGRLAAGYERLECPDTGSYVQAIASGADQLRQYTATNVFCDEFAFWERARESWSAMRPTIEGGGHIDLVSSANLGSYMYDLIYPSEVAEK